MSPSKQDMQQIHLWNGSILTQMQACVQDLVQMQTGSNPGAIAVWAWDGELTYQQLDIQAKQIANYLVGLGVGPEVIVALCLDKSKWTLVAILAVLKAGGVVVLLDVQYPKARLNGILQDTGATTLLADTRQATRLSEAVPNILTVGISLLESRPLSSPGRVFKGARQSHATFGFF